MNSRLTFDVVPLGDVSGEDMDFVSGGGLPVVLVVDDERIIADTLSIILSKSGFSTMTAYDGVSGLEMARRTPPDLVISDVVMPRMSGIELAILITQMDPDCKILLFSGQAATVDLLERARREGYFFPTLTKPVHPTDMLRRVSKCLEPVGAYVCQ